MQQLALRDPDDSRRELQSPQSVLRVRPKDKRTYAELLAHARGARMTSGIVYCLSRKRVDELAAALRADGVRALPYHAGLDAKSAAAIRTPSFATTRASWSRRSRSAWASTNPTCAGSCTTICRARWKSYYQESGRAGRDGDPAQCVLYFGAGDIRTAEFLIQQKIDPVSGEPLEDEQRIARQQLRQVSELRRIDRVPARDSVALLRRDRSSGPCGALRQLHRAARAARTGPLQAQQFLSCIARLAQRRERFGAALPHRHPARLGIAAPHRSRACVAERLRHRQGAQRR